MKETGLSDSQISRLLAATSARLTSLVYAGKSNTLGTKAIAAIRALMDGGKLDELKIIGPNITDHEAFLQFLTDLPDIFNLSCLSISSVHVSQPQFEALVRFLATNPTTL